MTTIDKEQECQEMQATPEFKQKEKIRKLLYGVGIAICLVVSFFYYRSPSFTGTPHITQVAGMTIEPGNTTVQELVDSGFKISDNMIKYKNQFYDISSPVDGKSYSDFLSLMKDGKDYATIVVINEELGQKTLAECKVREVTVSEFNEDYQNATLDGVKLSELTIEFLTKNNGEPQDSYTIDQSEGGTVTATKWEDTHYSVTLETKGDGAVKLFRSKYE